VSLTLYAHPDGGHYVIMDDHSTSMKMDDGRWEPAVLYRRVVPSPGGGYMYEGKNHFVTTRQRWAERFTAIGDSTNARQ